MTLGFDNTSIEHRQTQMDTEQWSPDLSRTDCPQYVAIAEAIGSDIASGRLRPGDRLPPQRRIAEAIGLDVSSISRGYAEAARRGYVKAHVGKGTFVRDPKSDEVGPDPRRTLEEDPRMNMPPEPDDPVLIAQMQAGLAHVSANLVSLLRYQTATGSSRDREVALNWMHSNGIACSPDRLAIAPGAHAAIEAALRVMKGPRTVVLCESVTYPGIRAIAAGLNLRLVGLAEDAHGIKPEALEAAISTHDDVVLYLNPTLRNPTTHTIPALRRREIAQVLDRHGVPLIEDDAYQFVAADAPPPISSHVPHIAWHVTGISKAFGAGLRLAYTQVPDQTRLSAFVQAIRTGQVMTSPLSLALLSKWIEDGTATSIQSFVRKAARQRQHLAAEVLSGHAMQAHPDAYNLWLALPDGLGRAEVLARMSGQPIGLMPSDVFTVSGEAKERIRVCLGGPITMANLRRGLTALDEALVHPEWAG